MNPNEIRAKIAQARALLEGEKDKDVVKDLEAEIAKGEKALKDLASDNRTAEQRLRDELDALKAKDRERTQREELDRMADVLVQGAKAKADEENSRLARLMEETINEKLAKVGLGGGVTFTDKVAETMSQLRHGAKVSPDTSNHPQSVYGYMDAQGTFHPGQGPAVITRRGEKATTSMFILAIGRKALGLSSEEEIGQIQLALGMKALAEGAGATSSISGPNGGYLVPPQFSTELIENLYPYLALRSSGVSVIPMTSNIYLQPRLATPMVASYVGENAAVPVTQQTFAQFSLTARKLMGLVAISSEAVADSDPSIEGVVREDMAMQLGVAEDFAFFLGAGGNAPTGIFNMSGIQAIAPATNGDTVTYEMLVDMRTKLANANIPMVNRVWYTNPDLLGTIAKVKNPTSGNYVFVENTYSIPGSTAAPGMPPGQPGGKAAPSGTLLGMPVYTSTQIADYATGSAPITATLALVEASQLRIGQRGDISLDAFREATYIDGSSNTISAVQNDQVVFRAIMRHDIAARHAGAVVVHRGLIIV